MQLDYYRLREMLNKELFTSPHSLYPSTLTARAVVLHELELRP